MPYNPITPRIHVTVTSDQAAMINAFQRATGLASRADAVRLLLDVAGETMTGRGIRLWDRTIPRMKDRVVPAMAALRTR